MSRLAVSAALAAMLAEFGAAQTIADVETNDVEGVPKIEMLEALPVEEGDPLDSAAIEDALFGLRQTLADYGYFLPDLRATLEYQGDSTTVSLRFEIEPNERTFVDSVVVEVVEGIDDEARALVEARLRELQDEPFNAERTRNALDRSLNILERRGYPYAEAVVESIGRGDDATLRLTIDAGPRARIDRILLKGLDETDEAVVRRELGVEEGDLYAPEEAATIPRRLNRLQLFKPVAEPEFFLTEAGAGVLAISVEERRTNTFDAILGYVPEDGYGDGYFVGSIDASARNLLGTGRGAAFGWRQIDRRSQDLELAYREPWVLGLPVNARVAFGQEKRDTTYVRRRFGGSLEYAASYEFAVSVDGAVEETIPTERATPIFTVYRSTTRTAGVTLSAEDLDDPLAPRGGYSVAVSFAASVKEIAGPAEFLDETAPRDASQRRVSGTFETYQTVVANHVVAFKLVGKDLSGEAIEESDAWRFGGATTVRGYAEERFLATRAAWANLEYRVFVGARSYVYPLFDATYFYRATIDKAASVEDVRYGYGVGAAFETDLGILRVSYAVGDEDDFGEGNVHVGFVNEF
ncbi:MAG: BamA/TamA family outer membrane protein [Ignavibacteriales bacterium]|nr:BamA/TamA family outer membrane protein [Ignavibacteriales bacterium]